MIEVGKKGVHQIHWQTTRSTRFCIAGAARHKLRLSRTPRISQDKLQPDNAIVCPSLHTRCFALEAPESRTSPPLQPNHKSFYFRMRVTIPEVNTVRKIRKCEFQQRRHPSRPFLVQLCAAIWRMYLLRATLLKRDTKWATYSMQNSWRTMAHHSASSVCKLHGICLALVHCGKMMTLKGIVVRSSYRPRHRIHKIIAGTPLLQHSSDNFYLPPRWNTCWARFFWFTQPSDFKRVLLGETVQCDWVHPEHGEKWHLQQMDDCLKTPWSKNYWVKHWRNCPVALGSMLECSRRPCLCNFAHRMHLFEIIWLETSRLWQHSVLNGMHLFSDIKYLLRESSCYWKAAVLICHLADCSIPRTHQKSSYLA